jgi:hypothetical protein
VVGLSFEYALSLEGGAASFMEFAMNIHDRELTPLELTPLKVVIGMLVTMLLGFSILSLVFVAAH